jgi:membrane peptidoglycan carboxypeptidase
MGTDGAKRVVVNSVGREIRTLEEIPPVEGRRVQLTLDADLQKAAEEGFRHAGFNGAALILDPRNGEVLTYTSLPSYDPNDFSVGIDRVTWNALNTDKLKPLQNRVLQGRYSPGSTFKIVVATAALEEGLVTPDFKVTCSGGATFFGRYFKCHLKGGHGTVDMRHAIEKSCNVYFYTLGNMLGVDKIHKWAEKLGARGQDRHRSAERAGEPRPVHRVEDEALRREVVRRRDHLGVDRAGAGGGHARLAGGDDLHRRQRRHPRDAATCSRRSTRGTAGSRCRRPPSPTTPHSSPIRSPRCATACGWW